MNLLEVRRGHRLRRLRSRTPKGSGDSREVGPRCIESVPRRIGGRSGRIMCVQMPDADITAPGVRRVEGLRIHGSAVAAGQDGRSRQLGHLDPHEQSALGVDRIDFVREDRSGLVKEEKIASGGIGEGCKTEIGDVGGESHEHGDIGQGLLSKCGDDILRESELRAPGIVFQSYASRRHVVVEGTEVGTQRRANRMLRADRVRQVLQVIPFGRDGIGDRSGQ